MRHMTREYCLAKADECQREAERAKDPGTRRAFEFYVSHWRKLADTFPRQPRKQAPPADVHRRY